MNRGRTRLNPETEKIWMDIGARDLTWAQYGLYDAPIHLMRPDGAKHQSRAYKAVLRGDTLAAIVSSRYQLYPNEEALRLVEESGFKPKKVHYSKDGNSMWAEYLSERRQEVKKGDVVQVGFMIRNSIDGSTGFGADVFTYRLVCSNGAIRKGEDLASLQHRHIGKIQDYVKSMQTKIEQVLRLAEELIATYRVWDQIQVNQRLADALSDTIIPHKYLPRYFDISGDKLKIPEMGNPPTIYSAYNDLTAAIWHNEKAEMRSKALYLNQLHTAVERAVAPLQVK